MADKDIRVSITDEQGEIDFKVVQAENYDEALMESGLCESQLSEIDEGNVSVNFQLLS